MDVVRKEGSSDYRYRCLFKTFSDKGSPNNCSEKDWCILEELYPEFLRFFTIGKTYYYAGNSGKFPKIATIPSDLTMERILNIELNPEKMQVRNAGEKGVIPSKLYDLRNYAFYSNKRGEETDFTEEIKHQSVVITYYNDYEIITPSFVISPIFYFTSSRMRKKLFSSGFKFSSLYHDIGKDEHRVPFIKAKIGIPEFDIPFVYYFATNKYASNQAEKIRLDIVSQGIRPFYKSTHVPVKLLFPFNHSIRAKVRGRVCDECRKILVEEIQDFYSKDLFGFDEIIEEYSYVRGKNKNVIHLTTNSKDYMVAYNRTPKKKRSYPKSIEDVYEIFRWQQEEYRQNVAVLHKNVGEEEGKLSNADNISYRNEGAKRSRVLTFDASPHYRDKNAKPAELNRKMEQASSNSDEGRQFNLNDFEEMVSGLRNLGLDSVRMHKEMELPIKNIRLNNEKAYYKNGTVRKFSIVDISLNDDGQILHATLVEIDQSGLKKGISTFAIVWLSNFEKYTQIINSLLLFYLQRNKFLIIQDILKRDYNVNLIRKNHPKEKSHEFYTNWCNKLVKKIIEAGKSYSSKVENS